MTAHARARRGVLGRLADLARGHGPLPEPPGPFDGYKARYDAGYDHPRWEDDGRTVAEVTGAAEGDIAEAAARPGHPPWMTAPQPAIQPRLASFPAGPGALGAMYAAADLRDQRGHLAAEYEAFYGWTPQPGTSGSLARPYAPEPEPGPGPVSYPPLDLHADLDECVIFRGAVRDQFVRQEQARGNRLDGPWLPAYADLFRRRTAPAAVFQFRAPEWMIP